jgi:rhodanese-related sulfurtransferase
MFNLKSLFLAIVIISFPLNSFAQCQRRVAPPEPQPEPQVQARTVEEEVAAYPEVAYEELTTLIKEKKVFLVDANKKETYKNGHIPTAISYAKVGDKLEKKLPKDKTALVVAYCGSPECTGWLKPAKAATELGYTNVKHFSGGIKGWKEAGGATK